MEKMLLEFQSHKNLANKQVTTDSLKLAGYPTRYVSQVDPMPARTKLNFN